MFDRLGELAAEHADLEKALAAPAVHADPEHARALSRRYGEISPMVDAYHQWQRTVADEATARELAEEDPSFAAEAGQLARRRAQLEDQLNEYLVTLDPSDLRVDVYRSSGPGGQSVNTTDSAVRITHLPTGIVVSCQNEKSQLQNKEQALRILRARLLAQAEAEAEAQAAAERRSQVKAVDRSQRVRTYNFPENRISDHRVGYKAYNLDHVIDGDLDAVITALTEADQSERAAAANGG